MSQTGLRGPRSEDIRDPSGDDFRQDPPPQKQEIEIPLRGVDEKITLNWEDVFDRITNKLIQEQRNKMAQEALREYPEASIIVLNTQSGEVITTAEDSRGMMEDLREIDYNREQSLIVRRNEWHPR